MALTPEDLSLLTQEPSSLSDEQIDKLLAREEEINNDLDDLQSSFPNLLKKTRSYRAKKKKFAQLSIDDLIDMQNEILRNRSTILENDIDDSLPNSFFFPPSIDSDEYVIGELIGERQKI